MEGSLILILALLIDLALGEAPNRFHPVAWLGKLVGLELKLMPGSGRARQFIAGLLMVLVTAGALTPGIHLALQYIQPLNIFVYILLSACVLKNTFSLRGLWQAVEKVKNELAAGNLPRARRRAQTLVSRDVDALDRRQLFSAAIESCAENLCDSFVAPLLYYGLFGLPGAICYRIINTFDAMIGYHGRWEYAGKFAARADDVLNYIPARLSGLLIIPASALCKANARQGWRIMLAQHAVTESPNAGWTMCAMAGALDIRLEKYGCYSLGQDSSEIGLNSVTHSQQIMLAAAVLWTLLVLAWEAACYAAA